MDVVDHQQKMDRFVGDRPISSLARTLGVSPTTVNDCLKGRRPSRRHLMKLSEVSGLPVSYWLDDTIAPRDNPTLAERQPRGVEVGGPLAGRAHARHPDDHVRYDAPVEPGGKRLLWSPDITTLLIRTGSMKFDPYK